MVESQDELIMETTDEIGLYLMGEDTKDEEDDEDLMTMMEETLPHPLLLCHPLSLCHLLPPERSSLSRRNRRTPWR
jgi:hypothetical protein